MELFDSLFDKGADEDDCVGVGGGIQGSATAPLWKL